MRINKRIIVSFTSFPERINNLMPTLKSIFKQTIKPDKIVLYLAETEFKNREEDLPIYLKNLLKKNKFNIEWCNDLKCHKKYFYALQKYCEGIVILIDDDLVYDNDLIEKLIKSYLDFPYAVSTIRTHLMIKNPKSNSFVKYINWPRQTNAFIKKPSMQLFATTGSGTLIPPNLLKFDLFDEELIKKICLYSDDIWLKTIEVLSNVPVVQSNEFKGLKLVLKSQKNALFRQNVCNNKNDIYMKNIVEYIDGKFGKGFLLSKIFDSNIGYNLSSIEDICAAFLNRKYEKNITGIFDKIKIKIKKVLKIFI